MASHTAPNDATQQDSDSDDEEVTETSPCGRWEKHRKEVNQRNVPGIDCSFLAMDTEEGVEVVWNEVMFSERKSWKNKEEIFKRIFEKLTELEHPNIVKFYKCWVDMKGDLPRLIFITEFMTSGSLKQFLKKTTSNKIKSLNLKAWKRWCRQILSALSYLHGCDPPIVHGNLNCDTIFIQHNGLMKIGTVAPDAIHNHVKTFRQESRNMHFIAPEYDGESLFTALSSSNYGIPGHVVQCSSDIYSFGMVALEMASLELSESGSPVTTESIDACVEKLESSGQRDFIRQCLQHDPARRPTVHNLLLHPFLLEVYILKVLSGHCIVDCNPPQPENIESPEPDRVLAEIIHTDGREGVQFKYSNVQPLELEKFLEEIKTGLHPLTGMENSRQKKENPPRLNLSRPKSPENPEDGDAQRPEQDTVETRLITTIQCTVKDLEEGSGKHMTLLLKMDDKMNRQLNCDVQPDDTAVDLADELVHFGFINISDKMKLAAVIEDHIKWSFSDF